MPKTEYDKLVDLFGRMLVLPKKSRKPAKVFKPKLVRVTE